MPLGGSVQPLRGTDSIMWTIKFRNGNIKRFKFPIRTTPEGSIKPYDGKPKAEITNIDAIEFFTTNSIHTTDRSQLMNG